MRYDLKHIKALRRNAAKGLQRAQYLSQQPSAKLKRAQSVSLNRRKGVTVTLARTA